MIYNPFAWYWKADDGRIYSSAAFSLVQSTDDAYVAWLAAGNFPTRWPVDSSGVQTMAALQDVLSPYALFVDLKAYAASVRYQKEVGGAMVGGVLYPSDRESQAKLTAAALFAQVDAGQTFRWKLADGTFTDTLSAADMIQVAAAVGTFVNNCFSTEAAVAAAIDAGVITTKAQVDNEFD